MKDEDIYKDRASQIQAIDKTFEQAKEKVPYLNLLKLWFLT